MTQLANTTQFLGATADMRLHARDKVTAAAANVTAMPTKFTIPLPTLEPLSKPYKTFLETERNGTLNYYYFHPDHLGSSAYVSNGDKKIIQNMEYLPFGETLVDEHSNSFNSPFKYNAKEFDEETGNYYYSARYYDPKLSIFISVDPLAEKTMSPYGYCYQNPINLVDPSGMYPIYSEDGKYLGDDGRSGGGDLAFTGTVSKTNKDGKAIAFDNLSQFTDNHTEFQKISNIVNNESSGNKDESLWIAHTANNAIGDKSLGGHKTLYSQLKAYSTTSGKNTPLSTANNSDRANNARAAVIDVLSGGYDPTGCAKLWDGVDFLTTGLAHNKFSEYLSVSIDRTTFDNFAAGNKAYDGSSPHPDFFKNYNSGGAGFQSNGGNFYAPKQGTGPAWFHLQSVGTQGATIFWGIKPK